MATETGHDALLRLGGATAEAVARLLDGVAPGQVERGEVSVLPDGASPFASISFPAVALSAAFSESPTGGLVFMMSPQGAEQLSGEPEEGMSGEATAAGEGGLAGIAQRMLAAAAGVMGLVIGQQVEIDPPQIRRVEDQPAAEGMFGPVGNATATGFLLAGHACTLIQLLPEHMADAVAAAGGSGPGDAGLAEALGELRLRVWAEIGRTRVPLGRALELPPGAVVELDRAVDDPVEVFVNGLLFARGALVITDDGEWAIRLSSIEPNPLHRSPLS